MNYSEQDKERMLRYPIAGLLSLHGRRADRRGLQFSPFRDERTPSFKIDRERNIWYDHGEGTGGNVFTLAQRLLGLPDSRRNEVWDYLASLDPLVTPQEEPTKEDNTRESGHSIEIRSVSMELTPGMEIYARSRCIRPGLLSRYCRAITYTTGDSPREHTDIGFPCGNGEWVLRKPTDNPRYGCLKHCTSSHPTYIGPTGALTTEPSSDGVIVFEGFFDFLSWLEGRHTTLPFRDVCVLNSVSNTRRAMEFILSHARVTALLDNDRAGSEHTDMIREAADKAGIRFTDARFSLEGCKDVNEHLKASRQREGKGMRP